MKGADATLRVISKRRLREFWEKHPEAKDPLLHWYRVAKKAAWKMLADVRMDFRHADPVGACTVFNIKGNHYRLIAGVRYEMQRVFVLRVMTHKQYDTEDWKNECQCN
jgi:mRNA interferase HigB